MTDRDDVSGHDSVAEYDDVPERDDVPDRDHVLAPDDVPERDDVLDWGDLPDRHSVPPATVPLPDGGRAAGGAGGVRDGGRAGGDAGVRGTPLTADGGDLGGGQSTDDRGGADVPAGLQMADGQAGAGRGDTPVRRRKWSRADKINLSVSLAALLGVLGGVAVPALVRLYRYVERPRVTISSPRSGTALPNNRFGANGTAVHIPPGDQLWLVVLSGVQGRWYPVTPLTVREGGWSIARGVICPAAGSQVLEVFMVPGSGASQFEFYRNNGANTGIYSVPPSAILKAAARIQVSASRAAAC
jgi:hypothetical protein